MSNPCGDILDENGLYILDESGAYIWDELGPCDHSFSDAPSGGRASRPRLAVKPLPPPIEVFAATGQGRQTVSARMGLSVVFAGASNSQALSLFAEGQLEVSAVQRSEQSQGTIVSLRQKMTASTKSGQLNGSPASSVEMQLVAIAKSGGESLPVPEYVADLLPGSYFEPDVFDDEKAA